MTGRRQYPYGVSARPGWRVSFNVASVACNAARVMPVGQASFGELQDLCW